MNYTYLNQCRNASKSSRKNSACVLVQSKKELPKVIIPIALETKVHHKTFGDGKVIESGTEGYVSILFKDKVKKFLYPQAFEMGFLTKAVI